MRGLREEQVRGALLGTFVGDALGMPFEGSAPEACGPGPLEMLDARLGRGTYTDDTESMISVTESIVACGDVDPDHLGSALLAGHDPRRGYGRGTRSALERIARGVPVAAAADPGACGNGAAMRIAPVGVLHAHRPDALVEAARRSALVTHGDPVAVDAAVAQAVAVGAALRGADPLAAARAAVMEPELRDRLASAAELVGRYPTPEALGAALGNGVAGLDSVPSAIYAAVAHPSFEDAVTFAVRMGGDADTIAAMAGAIAGARDGADAIPGRWLDALEDGARGRSYVVGLAARLGELV